MPQLRIALAQVDSTVGDLSGNAAAVRTWSRRAADAGATLVAFPEMMLTGYPVEDLVFRESFVAASRSALTRLAADLTDDGLGELVVLLGFLDADGPARRADGVARATGPRNALAVLHRGRVVTRYYKHHLPTYGVFDEDRYFVPGGSATVLRLGPPQAPVDVAVAICEDLWQPGGPLAAAGAAGAGLVVAINGSPFEVDKGDQRLPTVATRAAEAGAPVAYVNLVGGQDELVFDGDSMIVAPDGRVLARAEQFREQLLVHDLALPAGPDEPAAPGTPLPVRWVELPVAGLGGGTISRNGLAAGDAAAVDVAAAGMATGGTGARLEPEEQVWRALVLGLRDYLTKNQLNSVVLGLSGGVDSSVVATIAADALGPQQVVGVSMPSHYSSTHSRQDAAELAKRLGLDFRTEPIQPMVDTFLANLSLSGVAVENLQARVRGVLLMALSNQEGHLVLSTGNKSELAVGYSTLYGDSVGGFNPLKDVPKTMVWRLGRWRNQHATATGELPPIPERVLTKPPSAELRPGQRDSDTLPPYEVLDPLLADYVDGDVGRDGLIEAGHDPAVVDMVVRMVDAAEYKRRQSPPGTKITFKAFGRDRRLPITNRSE